MDKLYENKWITSNDADLASKGFDTFLETVQHEYKDDFLMYDVNSKRIDHFICSCVHGNYKYRNCWKIIMFLFVLSHSQSVAERGFSINKEVEVENVKKVSLISQRLVYDHVMSSGKSLSDFKVSNDLVKSCRLAPSHYVKAMEDFKKVKVNDEKNRKQKLKINEIAELTKKKRAVEFCMKSLEPGIESYGTAAEEKSDLSLLAKANSLRYTVRKKKQLILELDYALEKLNDELKNI